MPQYLAVPTPKCNHIIGTYSETWSNIIIPSQSSVHKSPCQNSGFFHILTRYLYRVSSQHSLFIHRCSSVSLHSCKVLGMSRVGRKLKIPAHQSPASVPQGNVTILSSGVELHYQPEHFTSFELLQYIKWGTKFYFIQEHPHERSFKSFRRLWNLCH